MSILRKFVSVVLFFIIGLLLSFAGIFFIFSVVLNPANIKKTIAADQGYQKIDQAIKDYFNSPEQQSQDPGTAEFINQNINSQFLQQTTESALDKYYAWARGDQVEMKISLGNLINTNQIIEQLQAQGIEIPQDQLTQLKEVALPVPASNTRNQLKTFYDLVFGGYYYLLLIAGVLTVVLMLIRFNLKDRLYYLFHIVLWPTLSFLASYFLIFGFDRYYLKDDNLFSSVSQSYRGLAYGKTRIVTEMLLEAHLQLILLGVTASVLTLAGFLIANHYYKKLHSEEQPAAPKSITPPVQSSTSVSTSAPAERSKPAMPAVPPEPPKSAPVKPEEKPTTTETSATK